MAATRLGNLQKEETPEPDRNLGVSKNKVRGFIKGWIRRKHKKTRGKAFI